MIPVWWTHLAYLGEPSTVTLLEPQHPSAFRGIGANFAADIALSQPLPTGNATT